MATAARRRQKRHSPVRRRPSSNSQPIGRPAAPTSTSASKPGRPRRPPKHNQQNRSRLQRKGPEAVPFSFIAISQSGAARRMPRVRAVVKKQNPDAALHRRNGAGQRRGDPPGNCPASYQAPRAQALPRLAKCLLLRAGKPLRDPPLLSALQLTADKHLAFRARRPMLVAKACGRS
jgi:hypothetical protein